MGNSKVRSVSWFDRKNADGTFKHDGYTLVVIDHEVSSTLESLPASICKQATDDGIGFLYVKFGDSDAEITQIWGGRGTIPYTDKFCYLLWNSSGKSYYSKRPLYTVLMGCRNGYLPDSDTENAPTFDSVEDLRQHLSEIKQELIDDGYKVTVSTPLKDITRDLFKRYQSVEYIQYQPEEASDYYIPYSVEIVRV